MRAAIYARYSSDLQSEASIDDQVRLCRTRADRDEITVVEVFTDYAISGGALNSRPGMLSLMDAARRGAFDVVISEALDRISRDQEDIAAIYKRLTHAGVGIVTASEGEINELHIGLKGTMNALFLKDLALKTHRGLEGRVRQGKSGGGIAFGYDVVRALDDKGEPIRGERRINPAEADIIKRIFTEFTAGLSPRAIAKTLNSEGVPGPRGRPWRDTTIRGHHTRRTGILRNDLYIGTLVWNKQRYVKDPMTGKRLARPNPEDQWIIEAVPALRILDDDLWNGVQQRLAAIRTSPSVSKARDTRFWEHRRARHLFTGLMVCAECGGSMVAVGKDYMACDHARNQGTCANRRGVKRARIEGAVLETLKTNLMQPHLVEAFIREFHAEINRVEKQRTTQLQAKAGDIEKITRQLDGLYDAIADGLRTQGLKAKLESLEQRKIDLEDQLSHEPPPAPILHPNLAQLYRRKVEALQTSLNDANSRTESAEILRSLVESIKVRNVEGGFEIELVGEIVNMIGAAQTSPHNAKTAAREAAAIKHYASSVKVVAGIGFEPMTFRL
jgi:site-specific DNA recombinase